jgi:Glycosyl transferase family 2/Uncharacterized conserved protein (DUF2304)
MSIVLVLILIAVLGIVFSQFGGKLSATSAWHWWLVGLFLVLAAYRPEIYRPISDELGIKFISNFVLAALVMFLFLQGLSGQAESVNLARKLRQFVSSEAVNRYLVQNPGVPAPRVLVILPTYNEQDSVEAMVRELERLREVDKSLQFCFVNDGSTDNTDKALSRIDSANSMEHLTNINVSGVLRSGFSLAIVLGADFVVQCDADGQHPVSEIPRLIREAESKGIDCLIGSRFVTGRLSERLKDGSTSVLRAAGGQGLSWILKGLFGVYIADPTSGFRVYSRSAVTLLRKNMPDEYPEPESIAVLATHGLKIAESAVTMNARVAGVSSLSGLKSLAYMPKVVSALLGLRMRSLHL